MLFRRPRPSYALLPALLIAGGACRRAGTPVDDAALRAADADTADWLTHGRTYSEQRYSPLAEINEKSVATLHLAWYLDLHTTRGLEATPLVKDGILYTTGAWSVLYAVDGRDGRLLWTYDPRVPRATAKFACCDVVNRGPALYKDKVYVGTLDGRLIAVSARNGKPKWEVRTTPKGSAYTITGAPRAVKGMILIGNGGAEYGVRGYVSAYDAETGRLVWRTWTVPGDPSKPFESDSLRAAAATWNGDWWTAGGGGTVWDAIVYDPELDLVYVGTGNGSPWFRQLRSPQGGDNLYLSSILALRASTGQLVWHYQTTPGDSWDFTATQPLILADLAIGGRQRKVIMQAPKNGFFYVLDRVTGALISAKSYTRVTWASGIDSSGRPVEQKAAREPRALVYPSPNGGHNWQPMSYNPGTGLVYFAVHEGPGAYAADLGWLYDPKDMNTGYDNAYSGPEIGRWLTSRVRGWLVAWDPVAEKEVWHAFHPLPWSGGTLTTAGNLVFQGRADGEFRVYRATDGHLIWTLQAGTGIVAGPITYVANGEQYIAVMAGWGGAQALYNTPLGRGEAGPGRLLAFSLRGTADFPKAPAPATSTGPVPKPAFDVAVSDSGIRQGGALYGQYCARCHGIGAVSGGTIPDLRYITAQTHAAFQQIVRGGERLEQGMPSFAADLTPDQVWMIEGYVFSRAKAAAEPATAPARPIRNAARSRPRPPRPGRR